MDDRWEARRWWGPGRFVESKGLGVEKGERGGGGEALAGKRKKEADELRRGH